MSVAPSTSSCERARRWASLALDGELSELERAGLAEHVRGCVSCAEFARALGAFTGALRATPLEQPPAFELPRRRSLRARPALVAAAAALVLVAIGLGSLVGTLSSRGGMHASRASAASQKPFIDQQLLALDIASAAPRGTGRGRMIAS